MLIETGVFGNEVVPAGSLSEVFVARVVIPETEFAMLGIGHHERPGRLPACFRWCFDKLGAGGTRWSVMLRDAEYAEVYFARLRDAGAFVAKWSAEMASSGHPALVG